MLLVTMERNRYYRTFSNLIWNVPKDESESWRNSGIYGTGLYRILCPSTLALIYPSMPDCGPSNEALAEQWQLFTTTHGAYLELTLPCLISDCFLRFSFTTLLFTFIILQTQQFSTGVSRCALGAWVDILVSCFDVFPNIRRGATCIAP
jgi:hypothetical protein